MEIASKSELLFKQLVQLGEEITKIEDSWEHEDFEICAELENSFEAVFFDLIEQCCIDNYYWQYCPLMVYINTIQERKEEYLKRKISNTDITFFDEEIQCIKYFLVKPGKTKNGKKLGVNKGEVYVNFALPIRQKDDNQISFKRHLVPVLNINRKAKIISIQKQKIEYLKSLKNGNIEVVEVDYYRHIFKPDGYKLFVKCVDLYGDELTSQSITDWCSVFYGIEYLKLLSNTATLAYYLKELPSLTKDSDIYFTKGKSQSDIASSTLDKWRKRLDSIGKK